MCTDEYKLMEADCLKFVNFFLKERFYVVDSKSSKKLYNGAQRQSSWTMNSTSTYVFLK